MSKPWIAQPPIPPQDIDPGYTKDRKDVSAVDIQVGDTRKRVEYRRPSSAIGNLIAGVILLGLGSIFLALCAWVVVWIWSGIKALL